MTFWGCWTNKPCPHPWDSNIPDVACGYETKMTDIRCNQCHRQRPDDPQSQLSFADLGDAAKEQQTTNPKSQ